MGARTMAAGARPMPAGAGDGRSWGRRRPSAVAGCRLPVASRPGPTGLAGDQQLATGNCESDWHFTDFVPPALRGQVGYLEVGLRVWPPDVIPSHPGAFRHGQGPLAGYWIALELGPS